nr:Flp pilus assembly complex ATPase component TadA [Lachnospiraceae bacterium]
HTNSAASTVTRLVDMGIESYLIADALVGIIAQRLCRRVCKDCCTMEPADDREKKELGIPKEKWGEELLIPKATFNPGQCSKCGGVGYKGRIGVYEIMPVSRKLKHVISENSPVEEIERVAIEEGMSTLIMSAGRLVLKGITTMDEVYRVAYEG